MVITNLIANVHLVCMQAKEFHLILGMQHTNRYSLHSYDDKHRLLCFFVTVEVIVSIFNEVSGPGNHLLFRVNRIASISVHLCSDSTVVYFLANGPI